MDHYKEVEHSRHLKEVEEGSRTITALPLLAERLLVRQRIVSLNEGDATR